MGEVLGIIDAGSNSFRLCVVRLGPAPAWRVVDQAKAWVRLAEGLVPDGALVPTARRRGLEALRGFARICEERGVEHLMAVATAAVRQASDGEEFCAAARAAAGVPLRVISAAEEAELSLLGALNTLPATEGVLLDVGGASTEVVRFAGRRLTGSGSLPLGALNLTERLADGAIPAADLEGCLAEAFDALPALRGVPFGLPLVGVGGTVRTLAKIDRKVRRLELLPLHNYRMSAGALEEVVGRLTTGEREGLPGLIPQRAGLIAAGGALVRAAFRRAGASELWVSGAGLREGLIYQRLLAGRRPPVLGDVLEAGVESFLILHGLDRRRSQQAVRPAGELWDALKPLHGLEDEWRRVLTAAAALREAGMAVGPYKEGRHTFQLLVDGTVRGLSQRETLLMAAAAAYRGDPAELKALLAPYARLLADGDRRRIRRLGVMASLAWSLGRYAPAAVRVLGGRGSPAAWHLTVAAPEDGVWERREAAGWEVAFRRAFQATLITETPSD